MPPLLDRTSSWHPELRWIVAAATALTVAGVLVPPARLGRAARGVVVAGVAAGLIGTAAFGVATAAGPHTGSIPGVGPAVAQTSGTGGGRGGGGMPSGGSGSGGPSGTSNASGGFPGGSGSSSGSASSGGFPGGSGSAGSSGSATGGTAPGTSATSDERPSGTGGSMGGGATTGAALTKALKATSGTWAAAVAGDQTAAELELATGKAVIAIGGWSGSDNSPTLAQFKAYVAAGRIGYYLAGSNQGGQGGSSGVAAQISAWVTAHYTAATIGGQTVYDLSSPKA